MIQRAYLDIETTGLSHHRSQLTVIGIGIERQDQVEVRQLVGEDIGYETLKEMLAGVNRIYTYNGRRFDLPFIKQKVELDIERTFTHIDLMYFCWRQNLKGSLKNVERRLGIGRELADADGLDAIRWWWSFAKKGDRTALETLLKYNAEDVKNLKTLKDRLQVF